MQILPLFLVFLDKKTPVSVISVIPTTSPHHRHVPQCVIVFMVFNFPYYSLNKSSMVIWELIPFANAFLLSP